MKFVKKRAVDTLSICGSLFYVLVGRYVMVIVYYKKKRGNGLFG
ncbi:hypothetical protein CLONEX_01926 [[Clostridium] nexile DSM 1787]|nr:hypothetical protein CLONEX_01926 [[Clostridium] nexile DSM 1787]